jgi:hypothetical protein
MTFNIYIYVYILHRWCCFTNGWGYLYIPPLSFTQVIDGGEEGERVKAHTHTTYTRK